jgi:hypothetical protein
VFLLGFLWGGLAELFLVGSFEVPGRGAIRVCWLFGWRDWAFDNEVGWIWAAAGLKAMLSNRGSIVVGKCLLWIYRGS